MTDIEPQMNALLDALERNGYFHIERPLDDDDRDCGLERRVMVNGHLKAETLFAAYDAVGRPLPAGVKR